MNLVLNWVIRMNNNFAEIEGIGKLTYRSLYGFYEEPLLFSCTSKIGNNYLFIRLNSETAQWLAVAVSERRLELLERNDLEIRKAFTEPEEGFTYRVDEVAGDYNLDILKPEQLTNDMLPFPGEYLDYAGEQGFGTDSITVLANREKCGVVEIAFEEDDGHAHEISCAALGEALSNLQNLVCSLAYKEDKTFGQIPRTIRDQYELKVIDTFAASFGVKLKTNELDEEEKLKDFDEVFEKLDGLIAVSESADSFEKILSKESRRTFGYYYDFLNGLKRNKLGFCLYSASPFRRFNPRHMSTTQVGNMLQRIGIDIKEIKKEEQFEGTLKGINIDKKKFTFIAKADGEEVKINGNISKEMTERSFMVPCNTKVTVETTTSFDKTTGKEKHTFKLINVG